MNGKGTFLLEMGCEELCFTRDSQQCILYTHFEPFFSRPICDLLFDRSQRPHRAKSDPDVFTSHSRPTFPSVSEVTMFAEVRLGDMAYTGSRP